MEPTTQIHGQVDPPTQQLPTGSSGGGTSCRTCGSVIAGDQRYCLGCGARRADQRVPFADALAKPAEAAPAAAAAAKGGGAISPGLAAAIVCLAVLFLGTGVLVGRSGGSDGKQAAATPQVITVPAGGAAAADAGAATGGGAAATDPASTKAAKAKKFVAPKANDAKTQKKLNDALSCTPGKDCAEKSAKLPDSLATPGAPPPVKPGAKPQGSSTTFG